MAEDKMCKNSSSGELVDVPLGDDLNNGDHIVGQKTGSNGTSAGSSDTSSRRQLCCGGSRSKRVVQSAEELGVWEESLEDRANVFSRWFLSYLTPLLKLGSHKVLDQDDMGVPSQADLADHAYEVTKKQFEEQSEKARLVNEKRHAEYNEKIAKCSTDEQKKKIKPPQHKDPNIAWALVKGFGVWQLILGTIFYVISALLTFVPVMILNDLVKFFESGLPVNEYNGFAHPWIEVAGLAVVPILVSLLQTRHQTIMAHCAVFVRTAVSTMLYRKALRVSAAARATTSTGQVVNMMSNDTAQLQRFLQFAGMCLVAPIQIVLALVLIYQQVSYSCRRLSFVLR